MVKLTASPSTDRIRLHSAFAKPGVCVIAYQRVYMTPAGIELTRPPRLVPWSKVGDAFRIPMTGSLTPICCIAINDPDNWDLHFLGRDDFDDVIARGRPRRGSGA